MTGVSLIPKLAPPVLRALARSWRFVELDPESGRQGPPVKRAGNELYALWHQQLLMLMLRHRDENIAVMISRSRDGDLATPVVERLGFRVVRGSSSRSGAAGMSGMIAAAGDGHPLALTIDGPRGPARTCKPGAVIIGARANVAVVPTVAIPARGWALSSWDRFLVPAPGTRVFVTYGAPIAIPGGDPLDDTSPWQRSVESQMESLVALCEAAAGASWPRSREP